MAYTHTQLERRLAAGADLATTAVLAASRMGPCYQSIIVRAVSIRPTTAGGGGGPGKLTLWARPTPGSSTGQRELVSLNYTSAQVALGKVLVSANVQQKVIPGEEIIAEVVAGVTAAVGDVEMLYELSWEAVTTTNQTKV
jgi:hypothetical protein